MVFKAMSQERITKVKTDDGEKGLQCLRLGRWDAEKQQPTRQAENQKCMAWKPSEDSFEEKGMTSSAESCWRY